jgi:hypothetical protein
MLLFGLVSNRKIVHQHAKWAGLGLVLLAALAIGFFAWLNSVTGGSPYGSLLAKVVRIRLLHGEGIAAGRPTHYVWAATHLLPLPLGRGYSLFQDGDSFRPHSDHLRLLYSYGVIAYLATIYLLFRRLSSAPLLVLPALIAFSINSLIDDNKLMGLFLSLLAIWSVSFNQGNAHEGVVPSTPTSNAPATASRHPGLADGKAFA